MYRIENATPFTIDHSLLVAHMKNLMIYAYCKLICTHQYVQINRMNAKSNRVKNSNCFDNNKEEEVKHIIYRKALLVASFHSRDFIFSRDSLLELAAQVKIVTRSMQISCSGNYLIVFNIDFSVRFISSCLEARCKFKVFSYIILTSK